MGAAAEERDPSGDRARPMAVLSFAVVGFAVQQTAIVPAIADVQTSLHASAEWAAWLVTVYLTVATVATLAMGRLGDLHGRRRMLLYGLGIFAAASLGAALAPNIAVLIAFRALQGVGGSVYPLALSIARDQVPDGRVARSVAGLTAAFGVGTAVGFVGGGLLAQYSTWRWIFGAGTVLVTAAALLVHRYVPETRDRASGGFDVIGTAVLGLAAVGLLTALTVSVSAGWASPTTIGLLVVAAAAALAWALLERRAADPLVDLHVLRERPVLISNLATIGLGWALFGSFLLVPDFARAGGAYGLGESSFGVGLVLLPLAVGQLGAARLAGTLVQKVRARYVFAGGLALTGAALIGLSQVRAGVAPVAAAVFVLGVGAGAALQASSSVVTEGVAADVAAVSTSLNSTVRRLGGGVGGQVSTILLASFVVSSAQPQFVAFVVAYLIAAGLCVAGAGVALLGVRTG